ncbi:hypothetical protein [Kitasatospora sp. HPMI-4]
MNTDYGAWADPPEPADTKGPEPADEAEDLAEDGTFAKSPEDGP